MKYQVTVELINEVEGKPYPVKETVFEQTVSELDLIAVIKAVNKIA